ncbi:MAG: hypothetical protein NTW87_14790 [Planctomycetota bacterium]|nr:hypothetical protein [Planctomycetota bacterium]
MRNRREVPALFLCLLLASPAVCAESAANLLRNSRFQDDWLTLLPENKNHHWCYSSEFYNRRDYNPDGWSCKGSWQWRNADAPPGQRRMFLAAPEAHVTQRVNWVAVYDDRSLSGFPDAGGFPTMRAQRNLKPLSMVRDLTFRVRVRGKELPEKAAALRLALCPPGGTSGDPLGEIVQPVATETVALPSGSFDWQWVEVKLPAVAWLQAAKDAAAKDPKESAEAAKAGPALPATVSVTIAYKAPAGELEMDEAILTEPGPATPAIATRRHPMFILGGCS